MEFAEGLVRAEYVEGVSYPEARKLRSAGVERLIEMLGDPSEAAHHSNIVMALGISGRKTLRSQGRRVRSRLLAL